MNKTKTNNIPSRYVFQYGITLSGGEPIIFNRLQSCKNPAGIITGNPGTGKTTAAQEEIRNILQYTNDHVIVLDPDAEFHVFAKELNGEAVWHQLRSNLHINPLNILGYTGKLEDIRQKSDIIIAFLSVAMRRPSGLTKEERRVTRTAVLRIYKPFIDSAIKNYGEYDIAKLPTLSDLQKAMQAIATEKQKRNSSKTAAQVAHNLAEALDLYINHPDFKTFQKQTTFDNPNRFTVYPLKDWSGQWIHAAMLSVLDHAWQIAQENASRGIRTWIYFDTPNRMTDYEDCRKVLCDFWNAGKTKQIIPTLMTSMPEASPGNDSSFEPGEQLFADMLTHAEFAIILNKSSVTRQILEKGLRLKDNQKYIHNNPPGEGLLLAKHHQTPIKINRSEA